jgi:sugar O-acyltransferase (sialic acid O-acetyltransferase NeuD family)
MVSEQKNICIVGTGGMAREVLVCLKDCIKQNPKSFSGDICFMEKDANYSKSSIEGFPVIKQSHFNPETHEVLIAVGNVNLRKRIANNLPAETRYATLKHPTAVIADNIQIGEGSVIMAGAVLSCDIEVGRHTIIDRLATIGHDCRIGDFFHLGPISVLSGNVTIGEQVFVGTQAAIKENLKICSDALIGMGAIVIKSIEETGTYVGNPAKKIKGN